MGVGGRWKRGARPLRFPGGPTFLIQKKCFLSSMQHRETHLQSSNHHVFSSPITRPDERADWFLPREPRLAGRAARPVNPRGPPLAGPAARPDQPAGRDIPQWPAAADRTKDEDCPAFGRRSSSFSHQQDAQSLPRMCLENPCQVCLLLLLLFPLLFLVWSASSFSSSSFPLLLLIFLIRSSSSPHPTGYYQ